MNRPVGNVLKHLQGVRGEIYNTIFEDIIEETMILISVRLSSVSHKPSNVKMYCQSRQVPKEGTCGELGSSQLSG